jgi:hypothetical protein
MSLCGTSSLWTTKPTWCFNPKRDYMVWQEDRSADKTRTTLCQDSRFIQIWKRFPKHDLEVHQPYHNIPQNSF